MRCVSVAFSLLLVACKTTFDFVPVSEAEARRVALAAHAHEQTSVSYVDLGGHSHEAVASEMHVRRPFMSPDGMDAWIVGDDCKSGRCVLDTGSGGFELGKARKVPDGWAILGWSLGVSAVGGLVAGNVACFGTDVCANETKVAVGITDGVVATAAVVLLVYFTVIIIAVTHND